MFFLKFVRKLWPYSVTGMTRLAVNIKTTGRSYHQDISNSSGEKVDFDGFAIFSNGGNLGFLT